MDKPGLVDYLIAPLTWLERSSGWKRGGLLFLYAMTALMVGLLGWRALSLWRLPDIGDPFDVTALGTVELPEASNAMYPYFEAARKQVATGTANYHPASSKAWDTNVWSTADPEVRRWVVDNRPAFEVWLTGTERPDSLLVQPRELTNRSHIVAVFALRDFARLAMLEASRLREAGDVEGAWRLYRATLRSSRHAGMHGGSMQRLIGFGILAECRPHVSRWVDDPKVTPETLRRAIADLEACKRMTSPTSEMIRAEYFAFRSILDHPTDWRGHRLDGPDGNGLWYNHITIVPETRHFLMREPERSRRILGLITAGQLAQCERPPLVRPKLVSRKYGIYEVDDHTPRAVAAIPPEELVGWADRSAFSALSGNLTGALTRVDSEPGIFDTLLIRMAEHAYEVERGRPPQTYADLLGPYLKSLPEGIEPGDRVSAASAPD